MNPLNTAHIPDSDADDFDLDGLLAGAMQSVEESKRLKEARKTVKTRSNLPHSILSELMGDIKALETKREWIPKADVAFFEVQTCKRCGNVTPLFQGLMQRQASRLNRTVNRWVKATADENQGLPKEVKTHDSESEMCHFCMPDLGYSQDDLGVLFDDEDEQEFEDEVAADDSELEAALEHAANMEDLVDDLMTEQHVAQHTTEQEGDQNA